MTELLNGLLTIVFETYTTKTLPQKIIAKNKYIENFLDKTMYIETDTINHKEFLMVLKKAFAIKLYIMHIMLLWQKTKIKK